MANHQAAATISRMVATDEAASVRRRGGASTSASSSSSSSLAGGGGGGGGGVSVREHLRRFKDYDAQVCDVQPYSVTTDYVLLTTYHILLLPLTTYYILLLPLLLLTTY